MTGTGLMSRPRPATPQTEQAPWPLQGHITYSVDPFRHWHLDEVLPAFLLAPLARLTLPPSQHEATQGRRDTNNASRRFFDPGRQATEPACAAVAQRFQSPWLIDFWHSLCGVSLDRCFLRIEYCQDVAGFWLEPHTDIGAKRFTMLIYLVDPPPGESWGTDLLHADGTLAHRARGTANTAVFFIPGPDTWHGFAPRPITGTRRSLIVNYVGPEWRARHELCFPDQKVA
jgi:hypothetical protein